MTKRIVKLAQKAIDVKKEVHSKDDMLKLQKYIGVGTRTFQTYRSAISEARAKSGGKWQKKR
ncbi:hypothetical protein [Staphylococcus equorum]|uniref:hypothetical protein n=1 Tax=Staphylococcus equorum TaxID=246432 RepID=UPI003CEC79B8